MTGQEDGPRCGLEHQRNNSLMGPLITHNASVGDLSPQGGGRISATVEPCVADSRERSTDRGGASAELNRGHLQPFHSDECQINAGDITAPSGRCFVAVDRDLRLARVDGGQNMIASDDRGNRGLRFNAETCAAITKPSTAPATRTTDLLRSWMREWCDWLRLGIQFYLYRQITLASHFCNVDIPFNRKPDTEFDFSFDFLQGFDRDCSRSDHLGQS